MSVDYKAETTLERKTAIEARVKALIAQGPSILHVATIIRATHTGEDGGYTQALVGLVREKVAKADLLDGYTAARAMEFAGRKAYARKGSAQVLSDCRKHAANHLKLAMAAIAEQEARKATKVA